MRSPARPGRGPSGPRRLRRLRPRGPFSLCLLLVLASFEAAPRAVARAQSADLIEISDRGDILMVGEGSVPRRRLSTAILTRRTG